MPRPKNEVHEIHSFGRWVGYRGTMQPYDLRITASQVS